METRIWRALIVASAGMLAGMAGNGLDTAGAGGGACHVAPAMREAAGTEVQLSANCFAPTVLRVEPGATVTFRNIDPAAHHIAGVAYAWGTPWERPFQEGDTAEFTFSEAGTYPYSCYLHIGMAGTIVVGDGRAASAAAPAASQPVVARANDALAEAPATDAGGAGTTGDGTGRWAFALLGALVGLAAGGLVAGMWARRR